jgi:hypothetical protein
MVEFVAGSMLAQLSTPDMCLPIQYALTYPDRAPSDRVQTNLAKLGSLTFEEPDGERFPALALARSAGEQGGTLPAVLNAAARWTGTRWCCIRTWSKFWNPMPGRGAKRRGEVRGPKSENRTTQERPTRGLGRRKREIRNPNGKHEFGNWGLGHLSAFGFRASSLGLLPARWLLYWTLCPIWG